MMCADRWKHCETFGQDHRCFDCNVSYAENPTILRDDTLACVDCKAPETQDEMWWCWLVQKYCKVPT